MAVTLVNSHDFPGATLPGTGHVPVTTPGALLLLSHGKGGAMLADEETGAGRRDRAFRWLKGRGVLGGGLGPGFPGFLPQGKCPHGSLAESLPSSKVGTCPLPPVRVPPCLSPSSSLPAPSPLSSCASWYKEQGRIRPWPSTVAFPEVPGAGGGYPETRVRREASESRGKMESRGCRVFSA